MPPAFGVPTIEGQMRNTGPIELRPGVVQLSILDAGGQALPGVPIVAGEPLPERSLRESPRERLLELAGSAALRLRRVPLAPGEVRPFVAIALEDALPDSARRLRLEITEAPTTPASLPLARPVAPIVDPLTGIESGSGTEGAERIDSAESTESAGG
jgi:hypothetical protein